MIKKILLTGACLSSLFVASMPLQAAQQHALGGMPPSSHCPPCPGGGGQMGWVLIPYGSMPPGGTPCEPGHGAGGEAPGGLHEPAGPLPHHETPTHGILEPHHTTSHEPKHPIPVRSGSHVSEEDELEKNLRNEVAKLHCRDNPHNGKREKEWGKEWQGKVYFKELGQWVSHPVLPETNCESAQPKGEEPSKGEIKGAEEPKKNPVNIQEAISKGKRVLKKVDGENRWVRSYEDKLYANKNGKWELFEENPTGQTHPAAAPKGGEEESKQPEKEPVFFSSTNRPYTRGPGTYNPVVPGARGTPQEKLSPVNRPAPKAPEGE